MYLEYDLFMKVADVSLDIVLSNISNPSNALKRIKPESPSRPNFPINYQVLREKKFIRITPGFSKHTPRERKKNKDSDS